MVEVSEKNKIFRYLVWGLVGAGIVILINTWFLKPEPLPPSSPFQPTQIREIDFEILKTQELKEILPFEEIPFPEEIGRENPFEPY